MDKFSNFYDSWFNSQKDFIKKWMEGAETIRKTLLNSYGLNKEGAGDTSGLYGSWTSTVGKSFEDMMKNFPSGLGKDTFTKLFTGADSYMKLYEFWSPIVKAMQEKTMNVESFKDLIDPEKYKAVIDKVFGFTTPEALNELYGQSSNVFSTWASSSQNALKPWIDAMQKSMHIMPGLMSGEPESTMNIFNNMYGAFEQTIGKVFKMPPVGKDREKMELLLKTFDDYSVYLAKHTEFQHKMYVTGQKGMEKVIEAVAQKITEGAEIKSYNEFFNLWVSLNEKTFAGLLQSEEFSKLQGELLEAGLATRKGFQSLMELSLEDYPIALRSEMDDLYKTIHNLKRKVRTLEKKLADK